MVEKEEKAVMTASRKQHNEQWSARNVKATRERLHATIKANLPVMGYRALYCGYMLPVCKENQRLAILRRRAKLRGQSTSHIPLLCKVRMLSTVVRCRPPQVNSGTLYFGSPFLYCGASLPSTTQFLPNAVVPATVN